MWHDLIVPLSLLRTNAEAEIKRGKYKKHALETVLFCFSLCFCFCSGHMRNMQKHSEKHDLH
jgi:hypothetical protein